MTQAAPNAWLRQQPNWAKSWLEPRPPRHSSNGDGPRLALSFSVALHQAHFRTQPTEPPSGRGVRGLVNICMEDLNSNPTSDSSWVPVARLWAVFTTVS